MKSMILCMSLMLALTVFASFASNTEADRAAMDRMADLANNYGDNQPADRVQQFEPREFVPETVVNEREEDLTKTLVIGVMSH
ncbi:MAG: hypothetical protein AB7D51_00365 [Desulfovibrionaceae bacterium]